MENLLKERIIRLLKIVVVVNYIIWGPILLAWISHIYKISKNLTYPPSISIWASCFLMLIVITILIILVIVGLSFVWNYIMHGKWE